MEPISTIVTGYATDKLIDVAATAVGTHVIERWSRHRAREFFNAFCLAIAGTEISDDELRLMLNRLLADEKRSEIVFDAYRSVCLTKSRSTGPRVIALLTGELVNAESIADEGEEDIFAAAEQLSDGEFDEFGACVRDCKRKIGTGSKDAPTVQPNGAIVIMVNEDTTTSNWPSRESRSFGPLDLVEIGTWAPKLKQLGLVSDDVRERQWAFKEDSERHIDQDGVAREITWWLTLYKPALRLAELIDRVVPAARVFK